MNIQQSKYPIFLLVGIVLSFLLHFKSISTDIQGLHSWRQSQTMWNIRNFVRHDQNILNPRTNNFNEDNDNIYRYEFPVMQWTIAMTQKVFGEKIEVVRLSMFLLGILSTVGMYRIVLLLMEDKFVAVTSASLFQFAPIFYYYSVTPLPDILALAAGIWYIFFMLKFQEKLKKRHLILGSICLLISTLAKLPYLMFGMVSFMLFIQLIPKRQYTKFFLYSLVQGLILLPAVFWYLWVMPDWTGNPVLLGIFGGEYSMYEFAKLIGFHAVKMFPNQLLSFPVWIPFLIGLYSMKKSQLPIKWLYGLIGITLTYLVLQLTTIGRDHDYYLLPFLPWLFIVIAFGIQYLKTKIKRHELAALLLCIASESYSFVLTKDWNSLDKTAFNKDVFIHADALKKIVPNDERCIILNDHSTYIFSYQIDKMGYVFQGDYLPIEWVDDLMRNRNVQYLYSDSKKVNDYINDHQYIEKELATFGTVQVFKLQLPND